MSRPDVRLSKTLSYWLRHDPQAGGLALDEQGWADTNAVLRALGSKGLPSELSTLRSVVASNDKQRFDLSVDERRIRARQGHSVEIGQLWPRASPPEFLYHGTVAKALPGIRSEGLKRMRRHHVHLSPDVESARRVGSRRGSPVILKIRPGQMDARGYPFFLAANGVWLTDHVPPEYLGLVDQTCGGAERPKWRPS